MKALLLNQFARTLGCLLMCAAGPMCFAIDPDLPFDSGSTGADGELTFREIPVGRNAHAMAYDPVRHEMIIFGGYLGGPIGDMWAQHGNDWAQLTPATMPVGRYGHKMVWDAARQEIVMFGGTRNTGQLNETWTW